MSEIQLISFIKDSASVCSFAEDVVSLLKQDQIKNAILRPKILTLWDLLSEFNIKKEQLSEDKQKKLDDIIEGQLAQVEEYSLIILNQSHQILCSLFETFLIRMLDTIFDTKAETLMPLADQKEIKLEEIIKLGDYGKILALFKDKIFKRFSGASTRDQFEKYFKKLGFDIQRFFDMSHFKPEVQEKFKGWDLDKLISIFNERHAIVHDGELPLNALNDLCKRHDFFSKLITHISIEIYNKFNIKNNLDLPEALLQG